MNKFKIGDKVRILDGSKIANYTGSWSFGMENLIGNVCTVKDISFDYYGRLAYHLKENEFIWDERGLELVERKSDIEKKIVITTDGIKTVTAKLYEGKKVIKTAEAKCSPEDEFDFGIGAALTIERLLGNPKAMIKEEKYFTGKARCVKCRNDFLTEGKIYEFVDGYSVDDDGDRLPQVTQVKSLTHLNKVMLSNFEEVTDTDESLHEVVDSLTKLKDTLTKLKEIMQKE